VLLSALFRFASICFSVAICGPRFLLLSLGWSLDCATP
jgi:hypothetical protein